MLIPPKYVTPFRKGHKTDKNDALAIAIAAKQPEMKTVSLKSVEQQGLQSIERMRQHHSDSMTATSNMIRGLTYEFGHVIPKGHSALKRDILDILEDGENELPHAFREQLYDMFQFFLTIESALISVEKKLAELIKQQSMCIALMALEGVGPVNALGLSLALGEMVEALRMDARHRLV